MDVFTLTKSKTRQKILDLFFSNPDKDYYLREVEKEISISAGNIRRELLHLLKWGLFSKYNKGRLIYYKINPQSPLFNALKILMQYNIQFTKDIIKEGVLWMTKHPPNIASQDYYCQTRDIFQARLQSYSLHLEERMGTDAYLITAVAGEIGNNSFDHNLGNWPDLSGVYFAHDEKAKTIVLADQGQGVFQTISRVIPELKNDKEALIIAFTKHISGRAPEKRGNGLKFVTEIIRNKKWFLQFYSGKSSVTIVTNGDISFQNTEKYIQGCFAVIRY